MVVSSKTRQVKRTLSPHNYQKFSSQYSNLKIEDSFFLAFRAVAELLDKYRHIGTNLLDFGCGTGRSTRFLKGLGFETTGVDISQDMLRNARQLDPSGDYYWLEDRKIPFSKQSFDVIFQSFVLLEYSSLFKMKNTFEDINTVLRDNGIVVVVTGSEDYYRHSWLSFEIGDANTARSDNQPPLTSGCKVKVAIKGTDIVLYDYFWTNDDYRQVFQSSGFDVVEMVQPLAQGNEPFDWVNECELPCWSVYILQKK